SLAVLEKLLGDKPCEKTAQDDDASVKITEDGLNLESDFGGMSLRELALSERAQWCAGVFNACASIQKASGNHVRPAPIRCQNSDKETEGHNLVEAQGHN